MEINIRPFEAGDIPNKVKWINNSANNTYLHYDLPLEEEKTRVWFEQNKNRQDRYDAVIEVNGISCGLIGLLNIDCRNSKAEFYVSMGDVSYKGKGVSTQASRKLLDYAFWKLKLNRVYLYTETDNIPAQRLFEKVGFEREGWIHDDLYSRGSFVDRFVYGISKAKYYEKTKGITAIETPIQMLGSFHANQLFIKREDLYPVSFGGNKARKAELFFLEIENNDVDCVVTYGSSSSNHCRVVANLAASRGIPCWIITPEENRLETANSMLIRLFGAQHIFCSVSDVPKTIERTLQNLKAKGYNPYFIQGGGHGNIGTQAYVDCYQEICRYEQEKGVRFDYIFHASGTGTTQAGLICGQLLTGDMQRQIVGISIARSLPKGRTAVTESVQDYLTSQGKSRLFNDKAVHFETEYICGGYGKENTEIRETIRQMLKRYGIPLCTIYTGKAFWGMQEYIKRKYLEGKNVLFIHTGGTPLFFDDLKDL